MSVLEQLSSNLVTQLLMGLWTCLFSIAILKLWVGSQFQFRHWFRTERHWRGFMLMAAFEVCMFGTAMGSTVASAARWY